MCRHVWLCNYERPLTFLAAVVDAETEQSSPAQVDQLVSMTRDKIMLAELTEPSPVDEGPSPGGEAVRREVVLWPAGASRPVACNWETSLNRAIIGRDIVQDGESDRVFFLDVCCRAV